MIDDHVAAEDSAVNAAAGAPQISANSPTADELTDSANATLGERTV